MLRDLRKRYDELEPERKKYILCGAALFVVTVIILIILLLKQCGYCRSSETVGLNFDDAAVIGELNEKSLEKIQNDLNQLVQEGMFDVTMNVTPEFANGEAEGNLMIENPADNRYLMSLKITLDQSGANIYETGLIKPGYCIENDKLDFALPAGTYPAHATFYAHNPETGEEEGTVAFEMTIYVDN